MTDGLEGVAGDDPRAEATAWFARMRGPDAGHLQAEFDAWRAADPAHAAAYDGLLRKWDRSAFLANSALARDRDLGRASIWWRRPVPRIAAAIALVLLFGGLAALLAGRAAPRASQPVDYASVGGQLREIVLSDGVRVTLDAGAAIRVDSARRSVRLIAGRARVDIPASATAPPTIEAGSGAIAAQDCQFDIALAGPIVKVVAWRGALDLTSQASGAVARRIRLGTGQQLVFAPTMDWTGATRADPAELAWTRGMLSFKRTRLADAVAAINRYNRMQIVLDSAEIGNLQVTGGFRAHDPEGFARAVARIFHLSVGKTLDGTLSLVPAKKA